MNGEPFSMKMMVQGVDQVFLSGAQQAAARVSTWTLRRGVKKG